MLQFFSGNDRKDIIVAQLDEHSIYFKNLFSKVGTVERIYEFVRDIVKHGYDNNFAERITEIYPPNYDPTSRYGNYYYHGYNFHKFKYVSLCGIQYSLEIKYENNVNYYLTSDEVKQKLIVITQCYFNVYTNKMNGLFRIISQYLIFDLFGVVKDYIGFNELYGI